MSSQTHEISIPTAKPLPKADQDSVLVVEVATHELFDDGGADE